jgi:hypothetical protein
MCGSFAARMQMIRCGAIYHAATSSTDMKINKKKDNKEKYHKIAIKIISHT